MSGYGFFFFRRVLKDGGFIIFRILARYAVTLISSHYGDSRGQGICRYIDFSPLWKP